MTPEGIKIEVKSAAYLQAWEQRKLSRIGFTGLSARLLDEELGNYAGDRMYNADVYIFAVQTSTDHEAFDVLDTGQWEFYVASREAVVATRRRSLGLNAVRAIAGEPTALGGLHGAVIRAYAATCECRPRLSGSRVVWATGVGVPSVGSAGSGLHVAYGSAGELALSGSS